MTYVIITCIDLICLVSALSIAFVLWYDYMNGGKK